MGKNFWIIPLGILALGLFGCAPREAPVPLAPVPVEEVKPEVKEGWQAEWQKALEAARKEGRVIVYGFQTANMRDFIITTFKRDLGINVESVSGSSTVLAPKVMAERRAGIYLVDVLQGGSGPIFNILKPAGALDLLEPALILPEVSNYDMWYEKKLPFIDIERKYVFGYTAFPVATSMIINTSIIKKGELISYYDLLKPAFKGRIAMLDPTQGKGIAWFGSSLEKSSLDEEYMRNLAWQEPVIVRNERLLAEWVAHGKFPVVIGLQSEGIKEMQEAGATIQEVMLKEEKVHLGVGSGHVVLINEAPHPNAAKIFINWILTREVQTALSRLEDRQSARVDVPVDHLRPDQIRDSNMKYFNSGTEEYKLKQPEQIKLAIKIFANLLP